MRVAIYRNAFDNVPEQQDLTWGQLVERLSAHRISERCATWPCTDHKCPGKNGPAWSPVDISGARSNDNVKAVTVAVFDLDHISDEAAAEVIGRLEVNRSALVVHSTHKHGMTPGENSLRLVMPLSRAVKPAEWPAVRERIIQSLQVPADPATKDLSRIYYLPNSVKGTEPFVHAIEGLALDVDKIARLGPVTAAPQAVSSHITTHEPDPIDVNALAASIRKHASDEIRPYVTRFLRGEGLGPKGSANPLGGQDIAIQRLMSTAAFCSPDGTPWEAIEHLFRPCFQNTENESAEHLIAVAKEKFEKAIVRKLLRDAQRASDHAALEAAVGIARGGSTAEPLDEGEADWRGGLIYTKEKEPKLAVCEANVLRVLRNAPEWKDAIRFNHVSKKLELNHAPGGVKSIDALDVEISVWFQESTWGKLGLNPNPRMIGELLRAIPERMGYDPLLEYLDGLQWDGVKRAETFLERYFGAHGDPVEYLRAISRRWLISLIARGMRPGTKVDTVLCLEGAQGLGKSTALRILADPWFCDTKIDISNKDSWSLAGQFWLLELAEAEGMTRAQAEALKAFFSRRDDTYRAPYGRTNATTPRRALFAVTTNAQRFLRFDPTGYRRFWPVTCGALDLAALKEDRNQLLAEAVAAFRAGELWYFFPNTPEGQLAEAAARKREETIGEASQDIISEWLLSLHPGKPPEQGGRPRSVKVGELLTNANVFGLQRHQITRQREMETAEVLKAMGFEKYESARGRAWKVPDELLEAAQVQPIRSAAAPRAADTG